MTLHVAREAVINQAGLWARKSEVHGSATGLYGVDVQDGAEGGDLANRYKAR